MKANYQTKVNPLSVGLFPFGTMTDKEKKAWLLTAPYRRKEYEAVVDTMEMSVLYALRTLEGDEHGYVRLRRIWEQMIPTRVKLRTELRIQDGEYVIADTGKNVEDYYMREELRKIGVVPWEWQKHMTINEETGEVIFGSLR